MNSAPDGIEVTATATVADYWHLGRFIAHAGSDDQVMFLHGLQTGFEEMPNGPMQMQWMSDHAQAEQIDIRHIVQLLNNYFGDQS